MAREWPAEPLPACSNPAGTLEIRLTGTNTMANKKTDKDIVTVVGANVEDVRKLGMLEVMWQAYEANGGQDWMNRWTASYPHTP
ncbi:hypothetical protein AGMMS50222_03310 [Endomicrobiia bacterium]|nr:hypothetical protein AGMMS49556_02480 [Endomicrobiia bacterium]GHT74341.1 hypothetical protein AGMMS50222_03310 [Endomicrobiia bacterium]